MIARAAHVLLLAPVGRDAALAGEVLRRAGIETRACADVAELCEQARLGAGAVLITEEASAQADPFIEFLTGQEPWSDLPVVVLTSGRPSTRAELDALRQLESRHSITFHERPVRLMSLVSTLRSALQSRYRQYEVRDLVKRLGDGVRQRDEFLAFLGHELRNPLGTIRNWIEALRLGVATGERATMATQALDRQVRHMTRLVDDLLDLARVTQGRFDLKRAAIDLRSVTLQAIEMSSALVESRRHELVKDLPIAPVVVFGDEVRLVQVVGNLLTNAARYTEPGGRIEVRVRQAGHSAELRVSDNGSGMTPEILHRAFDLFVRGKSGHEGLGIGLTLARQVARLHGGELRAHSDGEGKGSEFTLFVPLAPSATCVEPDDDGVHGEARPLRILLVEDQRDQANALGLVLEAQGHSVRIAGSGVEAVETAIAWPPQLVLLDLDLPDMDGCEVARRLKAEVGLLAPLVVLSGFGQEADRHRTRAAGCRLHLTKPVTSAELARMFHTLRAENGATT